MPMFKPQEIYQFAIKIEESGEKFYRKVAQKIDDSEIQELFQFLAQEEVKHKKTFNAMLAKIEDYNPPESYPGEFFYYMQSYAEDLIFSDKKVEQDINEIRDPITALDYAIKVELDTISYYNEMKNTVLDSVSNKIESIINEERKHVVKLSKIKEKQLKKIT